MFAFRRSPTIFPPSVCCQRALMTEHPFEYQPIALSTWAYLSSLLMLALFFKFNRFWSVRNFDLVLVILLAPGILLIEFGEQLQQRAVQQISQPAAGVATPMDDDPGRETESTDGTGGVPGSDSLSDPVDSPETRRPEASGEESLRGRERPSSDPASGTTIEAAVTHPGDSLNPSVSESIDDQDAEEGQREEDALARELMEPTSEATPASPLQQASVWYQKFGYIWLFSTGGMLLIRLLLDPTLVRRPMLAPNLTIGGLVFLACSLLTFLFANIVTNGVSDEEIEGARGAVKMLQREAAEDAETRQLKKHGPGFPLFHLLPVIPTFEDGDQLMQTDAELPQHIHRYQIASQSLAILGQTALVLGLVLIGFFHFSNFKIGVGMATIYLMLPYTSQYTGDVMHILPAALLVWAVVSFRRPVWAGVCIGLASGVAYYPIFLLPLWISFYWDRGVKRFVLGVLSSLAFCVMGLALTSVDFGHFMDQLTAMFGFWLPLMDGLEGIWGLGWNRWYRLPILVAFIALCVSFVFWPLRKDLGMLFAYTGAIMVAVQFWHGFGGGLYMAWYLPMFLMVMFRPMMKGRIAVVELRDVSRRARVDRPDDLLPAA